VAFYDQDSGVLCVRTPKPLDAGQRDQLRRNGLKFNKDKGYWEGSSFSKDGVVLKIIESWGGVYLYRSVFGVDDAMSVAPTVAANNGLKRIMIKRSEREWIVLGGMR
jgi:hypothetical protein